MQYLCAHNYAKHCNDKNLIMLTSAYGSELIQFAKES